MGTTLSLTRTSYLLTQRLHELDERSEPIGPRIFVERIEGVREYTSGTMYHFHNVAIELHINGIMVFDIIHLFDCYMSYTKDKKYVDLFEMFYNELQLGVPKESHIKIFITDYERV